MCFSATASFSVAAATAVAGIATLRHVRQPRELVLAAVPLLFAAQQSVEGVLWLQFEGAPDPGTVSALSFLFLVFAKIVWPAYVPLAVRMVEPSPALRTVLGLLVALGGAISLYLLVEMIQAPPAAAVRGHSISYGSGVAAFSLEELPYLVCTCLPPVMSSHRAIRWFGAVIVVGFLVSAYAYLTTFVSVWCFFAAASSTVLYLYFRQAAVAAGPRTVGA
jgi:hypothetical protein